MSDEAHKMFSEFEQIIHEKEFITEGDLVIAAVSGGADSMAMLDLLDRLRQKSISIKLFAVHFDHQLRPESSYEAQLVQERCDKLDVKLLIGSADVASESIRNKRSVHDIAREFRYEYFAKIALKLKQKFSADNTPIIVTAHHFDDQVETVIMRLFSGSGLAGLSGIRPRLIWGDEQQIEIIRPLLKSRHNQLVQYCHSRGLEFANDPSNADTNYPRNNIRHRLSPMIEEHFGTSAFAGIVRSAEIIRGAEEYSNAEIEKLIADSVVNRRCCELELDYRQYCSYLGWLRLVSIKRIASSIGGETLRITYERCKAVERFICHNQGGALEIGGGISVTRTGNRIYFFKKPSAVEGKRLVVPGKYVIDDWGVLHLNVVELEKVDFPPPQRTLYIEWSSIGDVSLRLASVSPGDRISLFGMKGRRKVSDYLRDSGVPVYRRQYPAIWIENDIVAIPPFGISENAKISDLSLQALEITWEDA